MGKEKFTSKEFLSQLRVCPQLAYDFSNEEVLRETKRFLQYVGYELTEPTTPNMEVKPDFYGKRKASDTTYEIAGIVRRDMTEAGEGILTLDKIRKDLGDNPDYVVVTPPVNERYLIDFMCEQDYKWLKKIQFERYMIWLCNPEERSVWASFGAPKDTLFNEYLKFKGGGLGIQMLFSMPYRHESKEIQKELMEELEK